MLNFEKLSEERQERLMRVYSKGIDAVMESRVARPPKNHVLLRGITDELIGKKTGGMIHMPASTIKNCVIWEIVAIGPEAADSTYFTGNVGDHCVPMSAALDPLDPKWNTNYAMVECDDIPVVWDPLALDERLDEEKGYDPEHQRQVNLGLVTPDSDG